MSSLASKTKLLKEIEKGKGVQYVLDEAHKIMGNPALIFDMEYSLIAAPTDAVNDDPIWYEFMTHGKLNSETIEFFKKESFIDSVSNCVQLNGVTYLLSNRLKYNRIFGQLYNRDNLPIADLVMVACENPFEEYTPALIETVCAILSEEICQNEYYQEYGQIYQDRIITNLIEGSIEDRKIYSGHVSNLYTGLKPEVFLAVTDVTKSSFKDAALAHIRDLFKQTEPSFKYSIYSGHIIILISSDHPKLEQKNDLNNLSDLFEKENIHAGISRCFENLFDLRTHYLEAMHALNHGSKRINLY